MKKLPFKYRTPYFVPRTLVGEAEGDIWPNLICTTLSLVKSVTGEARAHAQN